MNAPCRCYCDSIISLNTSIAATSVCLFVFANTFLINRFFAVPTQTNVDLEPPVIVPYGSNEVSANLPAIVIAKFHLHDVIDDSASVNDSSDSSNT